MGSWKLVPHLERYAMFVVIYRWRLAEGAEEEFRDAWRRSTEAIYARRGSLGSRLMKAPDGAFYAMAQWPSRDLWENRSQPSDADADASRQMRELIESSLPPIELELTDDLLRDTLY